MLLCHITPHGITNGLIVSPWIRLLLTNLIQGWSWQLVQLHRYLRSSCLSCTCPSAGSVRNKSPDAHFHPMPPLQFAAAREAEKKLALSTAHESVSTPKRNML